MCSDLLPIKLEDCQKAGLYPADTVLGNPSGMELVHNYTCLTHCANFAAATVPGSADEAGGDEDGADTYIDVKAAADSAPCVRPASGAQLPVPPKRPRQLITGGEHSTGYVQVSMQPRSLVWRRPEVEVSEPPMGTSYVYCASVTS